MSQHSAHIEWQKAPNEMFIDGRYNRVHQWRFDGGFSILCAAHKFYRY